MNTPLSPVSGRLASLDILRGFDLFLLVFFQPVFVALGTRLNLPWLNGILYQFDHEVWVGFRFWDLVMPLFLFMTGASMPFSLSKYVGMSGSYWPVYRRILRRVFLLFIFGMIVQGNLLGLDSSHIYLYSNTLQSIAVGYFIAAVIQLHFSFRWQIGITLLLLFIYWIPITFLGDFTPAGNFAEQVYSKGIKNVNKADVICSTLIGGGTSLLGSAAGKLLGGKIEKAGSSLLNKGKDKLLSGMVRQTVGQSHSKLLRQGANFVAQGIKQINTYRGLSSSVGSLIGAVTSSAYNSFKFSILRW